MQIKIVQDYKSVPAGTECELPLFTILTGENGSGKTHLFEAISNNNHGHIFVNGIQLNAISYIGFGALNPQVDQQCDPTQISQRVRQIWQELSKGQQRPKSNHNISSPEQDPALARIRNKQHRDALVSISKQTGILPSQLTEDDISDNMSMMSLSGNNLFNTQFALIFKSYHVRYLDNKLNKVYQEEGVEDAPSYLDDEAFTKRYGEAPWEFVNSILHRLCLPYKVTNPMGTKRDTTFNFKLTHKDSGINISTNDLSTGEKTLMSLALAIYNSTSIGDRAEILILDEPDAPLHPSMSKMMLEIVEEEIVKKHGIPVLLSTHSPTTIACAPANALYKISSLEKAPVQCNLQDSMRILTYGIPNLRVSTEHRRQVFVEHNYDVIYFESLFDIVSRKVQFTTTPQFLPPHNLNGSNCDAVLEITRKLRDMGNDQVYGLIDWDCKNSPEDQVVILGLGNRYAIENYIFEPHFLGLYLVYKKFVAPNDIGLDNCNSYLDVTQKISSDTNSLQKIIDSVESRISWGTDDNSTIESTTIDGTVLRVRKDICSIKGHLLEELCKEAWPRLNSIRGNNDGDSALKKDIINTVINDFPGLLSQDIVNTFSELK